MDDPIRGILSNPLFQSLCVLLLTWIIKKRKWVPDGKASVWLTMGIALGVGVIDALAGGVALPACRFDLADPPAVLACVWAYVEAVFSAGGVALYSATAAYMFLRREVKGRAVLGERL